MIRAYNKNKDFFELAINEKQDGLFSSAIWIDALNPEADEIKFIEKQFGLQLPTKEEMYAIELSNRLYQENNAFFMTISVISNADTNNPLLQPISFILKQDVLITIRYIEPHPFREFISAKDKISCENLDGKDVLMSLLENIVNRVSDILEMRGHEIDDLSKKVFRPTKLTVKGRQSTNFEIILKKIGSNGDIISKSRESLATLSRMVSYIRNNKLKLESEETARIELLDIDIRSLSDHATFINNKINFLLDATLGMISIQQNNIIKIFTVATMVFLPPTLIASIYGMNFSHIPELNWKFGYLFALILMLFSAYIPFKYFKKKGWL
jgi:magnesium transporter